MMLAEPEHVEADAVGELHLLEDIGEGLVNADRLAGLRIAPCLDKSVDAEFHCAASENRGLVPAPRPQW
jgi:hypothetical protein